ncbi:ubiquitin carboxyl-terminal hydrolase 2-like isoform X3 [Amphiura filiformis]|uniref:ubiquitin carboxyl-terminal hydrolase 2-like isoform X3 n=1 Tax=Amphiura filiformis TaxID=82378 RepID=UPI003B21AC88
MMLRNSYAFVDALHDDVNKVRVKPRYDTDISDHLSDENKFMESWRRQTSREKSILSDLFVGVQRSTLHCMDCGNQRCTFDAFWDLSLPIPVHSTDPNRRIHLEECLKLYCDKEVLDGDNKVTCNYCRKRTSQQKWLQIEKFPQILVLHLKRFVETSNTYHIKSDNIHKNLSTVQFPLTRLSLECTTDKEIPPTYNCYAVANHCGNRGGGHYTAFCRHSTEDKWIMYSDERVSSLSSLTSVVSANAYILFYERTNPTSHL